MGGLERLRRERGLSQNELARIACVAQSTIAAIELGQTQDPRYKTLVALSNAIGCRVEDLIGPDGDAENGCN